MSATKKDLEAIGAKALVLHVDVTKENEVTAGIQKVVETFGRIDYAALVVLSHCLDVIQVPLTLDDLQQLCRRHRANQADC